MLNRQIKISVEKPSKAEVPTPKPRFKREDIEANIVFAKTHLRDAAIGGVGIYAAVKAISTLSEIAINIAPKR